MRRNVYDFDKTVYNGDSSVHFFCYCVKRHPRMLLDLPALGVHALRRYVFHAVTTTQMKQRLYRFLRLLPDTDAAVADFWATHRHNLKPWYLAQRADDDLIISASPEFLLSPICNELGVSLLASRVDPRTGVYDGINCHDTEKVRRMREAFPDCEIDAFYSDSYADTPLAKLAKCAYLVKGNAIGRFF